jgi:hypothetical protein
MQTIHYDENQEVEEPVGQPRLSFHFQTTVPLNFTLVAGHHTKPLIGASVLAIWLNKKVQKDLVLSSSSATESLWENPIPSIGFLLSLTSRLTGSATKRGKRVTASFVGSSFSESLFSQGVSPHQP